MSANPSLLFAALSNESKNSCHSCSPPLNFFTSTFRSFALITLHVSLLKLLFSVPFNVVVAVSTGTLDSLTMSFTSKIACSNSARISSASSNSFPYSSAFSSLLSFSLSIIASSRIFNVAILSLNPSHSWLSSFLSISPSVSLIFSFILLTIFLADPLCPSRTRFFFINSSILLMD